MPRVAHYLVAYLDLLGQSAKLRQLERLPKSPAEEAALMAVLRDTALPVKQFREAFAHHFESAAPDDEAIETIAPEHRDEFRRAFGLHPTFRGFSDSVVITVPLFGAAEVEQVAALIAVHRALSAVGAVALNFMATIGIPIRGGVD